MSIEARNDKPKLSITARAEERLAQRYLQPFISSTFREEYTVPRVMGIKLYDPRIWIGIPKRINERLFGRKHSPTYQVLPNTPQGRDEFYLKLQASGAIANANDFLSGYVTIDGINQLAMSSLPADEVVAISREGYGLWPIVHREMAGTNPDAVGLSLSNEQQTLLGTLEQNDIRKTNGMWFRDQRLDGKFHRHHVTEVSHPSLAEILSIWELFKRQQGEFPASHKKWMETRSTLPVSLQQVYEDLSNPEYARRNLERALIRGADHGAEFLEYYNTTEDFYLSRNGGGHARRDNGTLRVYDERGYLRLQAAKNHFTIGDHPRNLYVIADGTFQQKIWNAKNKEFLDSVVMPTDHVIAEMLERIRTTYRGCDAVNNALAFQSDRKKGLSLRVIPDERIMKNIVIADGHVPLEFSPVFIAYLKKHLAGFQIASDHKQPFMPTDEEMQKIIDSTARK